MKIAIVGATGMVGTVMLNVLEKYQFPLTELIPAASLASVGKDVLFQGKKISVVSVEEAIARRPHIALFSAGAAASELYAPQFATAGTYVIDNSSCWRMQKNIPLIVPEINAKLLSRNDRIIANPNCSTIQLVLALAPLHKRYKIKRVIVSTYQSVTGTGVKALQQMINERNGVAGETAYPWPIDMNCFPHGGNFLKNGYTTEEEKLVNETRKILGDPSILVSATVARIPVKGGHSESVNVEFHEEYSDREVINLLKQMPGIVVQDEPSKNIYPMPLFAEGKDDVFVGRIRRDDTQPATLNLWIVADNLRKGAATNAVQIALYLVKHILV